MPVLWEKYWKVTDMVILYTLPDCGICKMVKAKLQKKQIPYEEKNFAIIAQELGLEQAPVLVVKSENHEDYFMSPKKIVDWIEREA